MKKKSNILIIGDVCLDHTIYGTVYGTAPEAPVPVLKVEREEYRLGMAANVAANFKSLGCDVTLVFGSQTNLTMMNLLADHRINYKCYHLSKNRLTIKQRTVTNNTYLSRNDYEDVMSIEMLPLLKKIDLKRYDAIVLSDYGKGTIAYPKEIIDYLQSKCTAPIYVDPDKNKSVEEYSYVTCIKANKKESLAITGQKNVYSAIGHIEENCTFAIITQGDEPTLRVKGMYVEQYEIPTTKMVDCTGCGDVFLANLVYNMAKGKTVDQSIVNANKAAAKAVGQFGTTVL